MRRSALWSASFGAAAAEVAGMWFPALVAKAARAIISQYDIIQWSVADASLTPCTGRRRLCRAGRFSPRAAPIPGVPRSTRHRAGADAAAARSEEQQSEKQSLMRT